jgi:hypothetical protein
MKSEKRKVITNRRWRRKRRMLSEWTKAELESPSPGGEGAEGG